MSTNKRWTKTHFIESLNLQVIASYNPKEGTLQLYYSYANTLAAGATSLTHKEYEKMHRKWGIAASNKWTNWLYDLAARFLTRPLKEDVIPWRSSPYDVGDIDF